MWVWFGVVRLVVAGFVLWVCAAEWPAHAARERLRALPESDFAMDVKALREEGRLGEALVVADSFARTMPSVHGTALDRERRYTLEARESWLRKLKDAGWGALTGEGTSGSALAGAVSSDLVTVGDVRDLIIEGAKRLVGAESDPVISALSGVGLATTLAPPIDSAVSVLKWARRNGALRDELGSEVVRMAQDRSILQAGGLAWDVSTLVDRATPSGAITILRGCRTSGDVARVARMVSQNPDGAAALIVTGEVGAGVITGAPNDGVAAAREEVVVLASQKRAGRVFLQSAAVKPILRGHPLTRLLGGVGRGYPARMVVELLQRADGWLGWLIAGSTAWCGMELAVVGWFGWHGRPRRSGAAFGPSPKADERAPDSGGLSPLDRVKRPEK